MLRKPEINLQTDLKAETQITIKKAITEMKITKNKKNHREIYGHAPELMILNSI